MMELGDQQGVEYHGSGYPGAVLLTVPLPNYPVLIVTADMEDLLDQESRITINSVERVCWV